MSTEKDFTVAASKDESAVNLLPTDAFAAIGRFLYAVRMRKGVMLTCLSVCALGAAAYYSLAPRLYDSEAEVFIIAPDGGTSSSQATDPVLKIMPTHVKLVQCPEVLNKALSKLHPDSQVDFKGMRKEARADALRRNLRVSN